MKRTGIFFITLISMASCKRMYQCSCHETTTYTYIPGEPTSHDAYSYIKHATKKDFTADCKGHEFTYQDTTKTVVNLCDVTEE